MGTEDLHPHLALSALQASPGVSFLRALDSHPWLPRAESDQAEECAMQKQFPQFQIQGSGH